MPHNTNTSGLPYGMSNVTNPAFIQAAQFLYAQYPGIYKMRIKHKGRTRRSVMISARRRARATALRQL